MVLEESSGEVSDVERVHSSGTVNVFKDKSLMCISFGLMVLLKIRLHKKGGESPTS